MMKKTLLLIFLLALVFPLSAQMPGGAKVEVSHKTQVVNGKRYFVHVVDRGQTVYAISRAYGLKEVEAVTKKDIHFLQVGDTVWLPCKGQKLADGTTAPQATEQVTQSAANQGTGVGSQPTTVRQPSVEEQKEEPIGPVATIRPRVNPQSIVVSLMMPFNLSQMDKISTSKFDVEQRGKTSYKSLEFIQFYEGLLLGLEKLEKRGYNVTLNVVDVEGNSDEDVEKAFNSHNVAQSDLLITMLTRQPFHKAAQLARDAQLFIVNPVADRPEIVKNNPYVFKCMPSYEAYAKRTVQAIQVSHPNAPIYIIHSKAKGESAALEALTAEIEARPSMTYSLFDWSQSSKLTNALKSGERAVVISMYDQDKSKNRIYVSQLLNKLSAFKSRAPYLYSYDDWSTLYGDIDFAQLQNLNYSTFYRDWISSDETHKEFIQLFNDRYSIEPTDVYAGMAHDIILYFVSGIQQKGTDFFRSPIIATPQGMIYPLSFSHSRADYGYENQYAILYRMSDFHFIPVQ